MAKPTPEPTPPIAPTATPLGVAPVQADVLNTAYAEETVSHEISIEQMVIALINARYQCQLADCTLSQGRAPVRVLPWPRDGFLTLS